MELDEHTFDANGKCSRCGVTRVWAEQADFSTCVSDEFLAMIDEANARQRANNND